VAGVAPEVEIKPFTDSLESLRRAVTERVFSVKVDNVYQEPPRPDAGVFTARLAGVRSMLVPLLPRTAPRSHAAFVASYEGRKRQRYQRALDDVRAGRSSLEEDAKLKVFVKYEKTDRTNKSDPVPRVISPRDPRFNLRIGRYLKFLEKPLFQAIDRLFGEPTILKGYNATEVADIVRSKWEKYQHPVAIGLDASRFDQHVSLEALRWEHRMYLDCYPEKKHRDRLHRLLKFQEVNRCYGETPDGELHYSVVGTRMSGDMNTSMGNCLLMCSMMYAYLQHIGVSASLCNNGDDCVLIFERECLQRVTENLDVWFLGMGFSMAVEKPVDVLEQIEFCQTKPVFDGTQYIMCRNPHTAIPKDSVMLKRYDGERFFRGWLDSVGIGGLALAGGLPIFNEFYQMFVRSGKRRKISEEFLPWSFRQLAKGVNRGYGAVSPHARASFYLAFDITPDEQLVMEREYCHRVISGQPTTHFWREAFREGF
jgi:hypothetical protein